MRELDEGVLLWLHPPRSGGLALWFWVALTVVGSGWSLLGLLPLVALPRTRRFALWMTTTLGANAALVALLKATLCRDRPCRVLPEVQALVFAAPTDCSLPSGHAAGSFCFAAFVIACAWRGGVPPRRVALWGALLGLFATGIALSRVALGVHWPSDVAAGALLGSVLGALFGARAPWPAPGGGA